MDSFFVAVFYTLAIAVRAQGNVYCDPKICPKGLQPHVACNAEPVRKLLFVMWFKNNDRNLNKKYVYLNIQAWYPNCQEAEQIDMTDAVKQAILDKHNELRNIQASGGTPGYPPAKRMATMVSIFFYLILEEKFFSIWFWNIIKVNSF